ncbi:MAG TPA: S41 family peptidase [Sphingobacteriaceae bacterium]
MKRLLPAAFFILLTSPLKAQMPDSVRAHLDSALLLLQQKSLYHKKVNWDQTRAMMLEKAASATSRRETFEAIAAAFGQLGDRHGFFMQYGQQYRLPDSALTNRLSDSLKAEWGKGWRIQTAMLGKVAYFRMPNINAFSREQVDAFANRLYDSVASLAARNPKSWIIDLRRNAGGNIRPMMAALAPFFRDGITSYELNRDGQPTGYSGFRDGNYVSNDTLIEATVNNKIGRFHRVRVAVLIGPGTGSSGEGVAAVLRERKRTRLFGEPTAGFTNSTEGFLFNNENSYFLLTTSQVAGRNKRPVPDTIVPDVSLKNNDHFNSLLTDHAVIEAMKWLKQPGR